MYLHYTLAFVLNGGLTGDFLGDILGSGVSGTNVSFLALAANLLAKESEKKEKMKVFLKRSYQGYISLKFNYVGQNKTTSSEP